MGFTVQDFHDLIRLLEEREDWRRELRRLLLTEDLLEVPQRLQEHRAAAEAFYAATEAHFRQTDAQIAALAEAQRQTEQVLQTLAQQIQALALQNQRLAQHIDTLTQRVDALAQRVDDLAQQMVTLTSRVDDLTQRVDALTQRVDDLAQQMVTLTRRVDDLTQRVDALAQRVDDLAQQMITLTRRVDDLTQQVARLTGQAQQIVQRQDQMQKTLDRLGSLLGPAVEDRMVQALRLWLEDRGWRLQVPVFSLTVNGIGELDGLVRAYTPEGAEVWLLVSVKSKVWPRDILNFVGFLQAPETAAALAAEGQPQAMFPVVFGLAVDRRALEQAKQLGVGLLIGAQGMVVPPARWSLQADRLLRVDTSA